MLLIPCLVLNFVKAYIPSSKALANNLEINDTSLNSMNSFSIYSYVTLTDIQTVYNNKLAVVSQHLFSAFQFQSRRLASRESVQTHSSNVTLKRDDGKVIGAHKSPHCLAFPSVRKNLS